MGKYCGKCHVGRWLRVNPVSQDIKEGWKKEVGGRGPQGGRVENGNRRGVLQEDYDYGYGHTIGGLGLENSLLSF
jgi:hypothetical protein